MKRTLTALAFTLPEGAGAFAPAARIGRTRGLRLGIHTPAVSSRMGSKHLFSTFQPPEPPQSKGPNTFRDVDLSVLSTAAMQSSIRNSDPNAVFVINGASRGIGFQFVKELLERTKGKIVACCRSPETAANLQQLLSSLDAEARDRIELLQLDVADQESIEEAARAIQATHNRVDVLLNVAGILGDGTTTPGPERSVTKIDRDWMESNFAVNAIGPTLLIQALTPMMVQRRQRKKKQPADAPEPTRAVSVVASLSARVGSISDNGIGGWYSYRMSKAALNQATRTLAHELKRQSVWCIALHPGTTDTDLSKPFQKNVQESRLFPVEFSVESLMNVIDCLEDDHSGGLYDWAGKAIPF